MLTTNLKGAFHINLQLGNEPNSEGSIIRNRINLKSGNTPDEANFTIVNTEINSSASNNSTREIKNRDQLLKDNFAVVSENSTKKKKYNNSVVNNHGQQITDASDGTEKDKDLRAESVIIADNNTEKALADEVIQPEDDNKLANNEREQSVVIKSNQTDSKIQIVDNTNEINDNANEFADIDKSFGNWSFGAVASPLYSYRNVSQQSEDIAFEWSGGDSNKANEQAIIAYAGGFDVEYSLDRWSFSSGVYFSRMGQETNNFTINRISVSGTESVIYAATSLNTIQIKQSNSGTHAIVGGQYDASSLPELSSNDAIETTAILTQEFEFVEMPFVARYSIIDKKIDVQLVTGLSAGYLIRTINNLEYLGQNLDLGSSSNINRINYNTLMGFALQLPVGRKMKFRLEPQFKYAINSLNKDYSISYHPYSFAMYTGLMYEF